MMKTKSNVPKSILLAFSLRTVSILMISLATLVSSVALVTMVSCTKKASSDPKTLFVGISATPATLDPRNAMDASGMRLTNLLFSSIVRLGPDLEIIGEAASQWSYKNLTYSFVLRPGLQFIGADGNSFPVTKEDLEFTFETFRKSGRFASSLEPITSVEASYDVNAGGTLAIKLKSYSATLLTDLSPVKILPKKIVQEKGDSFRDHPVGSGPFRFVAADANEIRLSANSKCPYVQPKTENLVFKIVREDNTRFLKIMKGELDLVQQDLPPAKVIELEKKGGFQIHKYPGLSMTYLLVNLREKSLQSKETRQALSMAINREEIIRFKLEGLAQPATSVLSPINPYHDGSLVAPKFDLEQAKKIIQAAGLLGTEITLKTSNSTQAVENGKVLANQLQSAGLKVNLQSFEWATFYKDIDQGNFQLATMKWVGTTDPDIYKTAFHSAEVPPKGRNRGSYSNAQVDRLVDLGRGIEDVGKRIDHYKRVQKIVYDDLPMIPLWYEYEVAVANPRVKNYAPSKNGDYTSLLKVEKN